ncbi:PREDICTED: chloride anion exchanger-like [Priapulus caudatus]|uniref:Chloride anion exchanger-like n=1 Tax=Priapulus caudatus TaxID=37621 RepID=A0ABM1EPP4_PRICU|nr:PREDICTED: chloride anion exchanger-like [Priapulus caudatus]
MWCMSLTVCQCDSVIVRPCDSVIMRQCDSMGFSLLANLPPVYGLYVSIFPVLIYSFLGSSRYLSNGTFAVISLMVANVVNRLATDPSGASTLPGHMSSDNVTDSIINGTDPVVITGIQVATCMALFIGILQIPLGFLRFGFITAYLSESLIRAFTTGAAMHVVTSQIKHLFGVSVSSYTGVLRLPYTWIDFFSKLMTTNWVALVLGVATIVFLVVMRECVNDKYKSKMFMPIPAELVVVVVMTGISYGAKLEKDWNLTVVGEIRPGLPQPSVPDVSLFPDMIGDVIAVAIISWVFNVGMAEILARKRDQEIDADQEMIALGAAHVFSSFFSCFPGTNALARSLIQESVGGVTQIAGLVSCVIVIIVSLWLGPLLYDLPNSVFGWNHPSVSEGNVPAVQ